MRIITIVLSAFIALYAGALAASVGKGTHGFLYNQNGQPSETDYLTLWAAGKLAAQGNAPAAYDWEKHYHAQAEGLGRLPPTLGPIAYPPTFLLVMAPFGTLPYQTSYLLFGLLTLALYATVNAAILGRPEGAIWMTATVATVVCFWLGQNGLLTAALLGLGLLLIPSRPILAGAALGILSYKPHFGLLIPFALAAAGYWRSFAAAAVTAVLFALASLILLGADTWIAALDGMSRFSEFMLYTYKTPERLQSVFGALRALGVPVSPALAIQAVLTLALIATVVLVWRSTAPFKLKAALLAAATVMPTPYLFIYDLTVLTIAQAFILAHVLPKQLERPELYAIAGTNLLIAGTIGLGFPLAMFAAPLLLALVVWRMWPQLSIRGASARPPALQPN